MSSMADDKKNVDVVFLDPPRAGSTEKFLKSLVTLKPKKVVYISCNPVTLERDLNTLHDMAIRSIRYNRSICSHGRGMLSVSS